MTSEDAVRYLANIYSVIDADGRTDPVQERAIELISSEIHAGYFERMRARDLAAQKRQSLPAQLPVRWSERIRNLEDMMFVAFCDKVLDPTEKQAIIEYARPLGIHQEQLAMIKEEAQRRCKELR